MQPTAAANATKLSLWHPYSGATGKAFETLIYDFNMSHPTISIVPSYGGSLDHAGQAPDRHRRQGRPRHLHH